MQFTRTQLLIALGARALLVIVFSGHPMRLNNHGPVLSRSRNHDPLSGTSNAISLNPLRDRSSEREASTFIRAMRDGRCREQLADWENDYRRKYAAFICESETKHPLLSWEIVDWEDTPPLRILHYRGKRLIAAGEQKTYSELFSVTLERKAADWDVTKYDAIY